MIKLSIGLGLFGSGVNRVRVWILKNCPALIGPDPGAKSKFLVSEKVFAIAGLKQRERHVASISLSHRCDYRWVNS